MGEVYKARDTRLNRTVAIKVLPEHVAQNAERKQRFVREAQAIAALNHPNICVVHDVGEDSRTHYLVMEYLEGETLAARLEKGPVPMDQALKYAVEIADALDKAHQREVVHRDIKPGNIMLTKSGAKLLDFGLAKLGSSPVTGQDPLETAGKGQSDLTAQGTILGTLQYMAPEQIEGEEADARSDIFAFGVVVYEMITGKKAFKGKSQASLIASILEHDPIPISALQQMTPPALDRLVRTCLAKEPENRWQNAHDLMIQLRWVVDGGPEMTITSVVIARRKWRERVAWSLATLGLLGTVAFAVAHFRTPMADAPAVEFSIAPPDNTFFTVGTVAVAPFPAVSPDGRHIAFVATKVGTNPRRIWVRSLDSPDARELPGTEGAIGTFWSPDSRQIGFFAEGKLKRVEYSGGPALVVSNVADFASGGTWNRDGTILFAQRPTGGLSRVSASGGEATPVTTPDASRKEMRHHWPYFLPDGRHFLYLAEPPSTIWVASLDSKETKQLPNADSMAVYASPGYLLFVRQATLMGQAFDAAHLALQGEPFRIAENVRFIGNGNGNGAAAFSVSDTGVLVYRSGANISAVKTVWFDRTGRELEPINQTGDSRNPRLSPDDSRIAVQRQDPGGRGDIWVIDLARGTNSRVTFNATDESYPIWSPDGTRIVYASNQNGKLDLYQKASTGAGNEELVLKSDQDKLPVDWSSDGKLLLFRSTDPKTLFDLWILPLNGDRKPVPFAQAPFNEAWASFSPDGKWIAYSSDESGNYQVYVQPFPPTGDKTQISVDIGLTPFWRRDGKELFFLTSDNRVFSVDVELGAKFRAGVPKSLFQARGLASIAAALRASVARDGKRFLLVTTGETTESPLTVLLNWTSALKK